MKKHSGAQSSVSLFTGRYMTTHHQTPVTACLSACPPASHPHLSSLSSTLLPFLRGSGRLTITSLLY